MEFVSNFLVLFLVISIFFFKVFFTIFAFFLYLSISLSVTSFSILTHTHCTLFPQTPVCGYEYTTHAYKIKHMHVYLENQGLIHMLEFPFDLNHFLLCVVVVIATRKQSLNYYCQVLCSLSH